ncbi:toxin glutamine deamidase domain-containing protein [Streptomyces chartreusis]|uniref:toxin glutamine deamidase domain-containing protein n=1 Tax=Streptomyces chartreusis TaxID=1969 RepID=UPI0036532DBD
MTTPPPSHGDPATPQNPGSPQATPNDPGNQHHPNQDSLDDIRSDLDHYPGGLTEPDPADQQALADAVPRNDDGTPERFPDPHGPWSQLQNDGGNTVPGRSNNCADCSRSFLETWYGNPQVSAPRTVDTDANGNPDYWSPEDNANDNQIRWTGASHTYAGPGGDPNTANNIASVLQQSGPGSAAIVQVDWPGGGGHAFNVVNHDGNIVWIDTQSGDVSDQPLHLDQAEHVWHIPLDANRNPIDLSQPDAADSNQGTDASQEGTDSSQDGTDSTQDGTDSSQNGSDTTQDGTDASQNGPDTTQDGPDASQQEPDDNSNQSSDDSKPDPETAQQDPQTAEDGPDTTQQEAHDNPKPTDSPTPDASNNTDAAQPSPTAPDTTASPTDNAPSSENSNNKSQDHKAVEPDGTADGPDRGPTQGTPESGQPTPDNNTADPDQQVQQPRPDEATPPDEQGHSRDGNSDQPTATAESSTRAGTPAEHESPTTHTTPSNTNSATPDNSSSSSSTSHSHQAASASASPHRAPTEPSGSNDKANKDSTQDDTKPKKPKKTAAEKAAEIARARDIANTPLDSSGPEGHPGYGVVQQGDGSSVHHDMLGDESQDLLRRTNDVVQTDLHAIAQSLHNWAQGNPSPLMQTIAEASQNSRMTQERLNELLKPGFAEMSREDKAATVAAIARLSSAFHDAHAVDDSGGADLHSRHQATRGEQLDPAPLARRYAATQDLADKDAQEADESGEALNDGDQQKSEKEVRQERLKFNRLWNRHVGDAQLKKAIEQAESEGKSQCEIDAMRQQRRMMRPDFSGKNFAALEVIEHKPDGTTETHYIIDSSNPPLDHSEPVLGEAFRRLDQENPGRYEAPLMYTEFEPCGDQTYPASANCSDYIAHEFERPADQDLKRYHEKTDEEKAAMPEQKNKTEVVYGAGYRLGELTQEEMERIQQLPPEERAAEIERARQQAVDARNADMHRFRGELARVWMKLAASADVP